MDNLEIRRFFHDTPAHIFANANLREPQVLGYQATLDYFAQTNEPGYVQLPVGTGKTGLMGITPFGLTEGRVLIVTPNTTIRQTVYDELDISRPERCFYLKRSVFITPPTGPFLSILKPGANIHDCDGAHIVIANIQQFSGPKNRWYERLARDYFALILVDEGHHNVADTWKRLFAYFDSARVISYTGTPLRADGQKVEGNKIYHYGYTRAMLMGFISPVEAVYVAPDTITFTAEGETNTYSLPQVLEMREHDWFSRGIAASEVCNRSIVQASIRQLMEVRQQGTPRQIIAAACSIRHASQIRALYHEYNLRAEVLHSHQSEEEQAATKAGLANGLIDAVVQVQMLGEGFDLSTLSVAAVFRPFRSISPYIQFIGRILRLANQTNPMPLANLVYVVSHVGLNDERWWTDFTNFDRDDQLFFAEYLGSGGSEIAETEGTPRLTLRPFMRVLNESVQRYIQKGFLKEVDKVGVQRILLEIRNAGFDPLEFGLTEDVMLRRLEMAAAAQREIAAYQPISQPQKRREALRLRLMPEARSVADTVINRLGLSHQGGQLIRFFPGRGQNNVAILTALASAAQNNKMGVDSGGRDEASEQQFQEAIDATPAIVDNLTALISGRMRAKEGANNGTT
jgi:superfamily II DNA or RNA helicase